jgi:hypothetical protein
MQCLIDGIECIVEIVGRAGRIAANLDAELAKLTFKDSVKNNFPKSPALR